MRWIQLSAPVRVAVVLVPALCMAIVLFVALAARPSSAALFSSPLHAEQLQEVEERLAAWNISFTPTQDNVMVDGRRRSELLLRLSLAGVPHAHLTGENEALSSVGVLTPQSVIDAQTLEGREGDVAAALRGVEGVQDARVLIAPATSGEFADQNRSDATASVWLRLEAGAQLSNETLGEIRSFVAAAVPGLEPERVSVLDDRGMGFATTSGGSSDAASLQAALQSALDAAFGAGATIVRVHADYAQQTVERREVARLPVAGAGVDSTQSSRAYHRGGETYREQSSQASRGTRTQETASSSPAGSLERLSTAVFVDASHAGDVFAIRSLSAAAVGFTPSRGDTLVVQALDFARIPPARKDVWWLAYGSIVPLLPTLACVAGMLFAFKLGLPAFRDAFVAFADRMRVADTARHAPAMPAGEVRTLLESEPPHAAAVVISALPAATAAAVLELYPQAEREAIVRRMRSAPPPLIPDAAELLSRLRSDA